MCFQIIAYIFYHLLNYLDHLHEYRPHRSIFKSCVIYSCSRGKPTPLFLNNSRNFEDWKCWFLRNLRHLRKRGRFSPGTTVLLYIIIFCHLVCWSCKYELKAVFLTLQTFCKDKHDIHVKTMLDHKTTIACSNKFGSVKAKLMFCTQILYEWA